MSDSLRGTFLTYTVDLFSHVTIVSTFTYNELHLNTCTFFCYFVCLVFSIIRK